MHISIFDRTPARHAGLATAAALLMVLAGLGACRSDPQAVKARSVQRGDDYLQQGKRAEAIIEYRNAVQADPQDGDARVKLAEAHLQHGHAAEAVREYVRAADLLLTRVDVQVKAGNLLLLAGRFDDAKVRAEKALAASPQNVQAQILLANALAGLKDFEAAIAEIEEAIRLDPNRGSTYASLGAFEAGRGRLEAAARAFTRATELDPRSVAAHLALANFYWAGRRWPEVEAAVSKALSVAPDDVMAHRAMASYALAVNRLDLAERHLKRVLDITKASDAALALADFYAARKDDPSARDILEPLTSAERSATQARIRLAALDHAAGRRDQAYSGLEQILLSDRTNLQALLVKAAMLLTDNREDEALAAAELATKAHSGSTAAFFTLARVQAARRQNDAAIAAYREVLRLNPKAISAQLALSRLHLAAGRTSESVGFAQDALRANPANPNARLALVGGLLARGDLQRAEEELARLSREYPASAAVEAKRGVLLGLRRETPAARAAFARALQLQPGMVEAVGGLVALDLSQKDHAAARARVAALLEKPDPGPAALMLAARTYSGTGDLQTAEELLRRILRAEPGFLPAYGALGRLYVRQKRLDEALAEFEALAEREARPVAALTLAGIILEAKGRNDEARARFERVIQIDPSAPVAANNLAWIYATTGGNLDVALQLAQAATAKLPDTAEVSDTLGFIYYKKDLLPQAIKALEHAVERDAANPTFQYHLGLALAKAGDKPAAVEHLKRALALNNGFEGAAEAKALLNELEAS